MDDQSEEKAKISEESNKKIRKLKRKIHELLAIEENQKTQLQEAQSKLMRFMSDRWPGSSKPVYRLQIGVKCGQLTYLIYNNQQRPRVAGSA